MSMEHVMLGAAAPTIASGVNVVARASNSAAQSFANIFESTSQFLAVGPNNNGSQAHLKINTSNENLSHVLLADRLAKSSSHSVLGISGLQDQVDTLQIDLEQRIQQALEKAGIQLEAPLRISISEFDGKLQVDGIHSHRALVESALNADPTLAADFKSLSDQRHLLESYGKSHPAKESGSNSWQELASQIVGNHGHYKATIEVASDNQRLQIIFD